MYIDKAFESAPTPKWGGICKSVTGKKYYENKFLLQQKLPI